MKREQSGGKGSYGQKEQMPHALQAHTDRHTQTALDKAAAAAAAASPKPAQPPSLCNRIFQPKWVLVTRFLRKFLNQRI